MKKFLLIITLLLSFLNINAQREETSSNTIKDIIKFMGIPVDGSKFEVEQRLRTEKGFTYENNDYRRAGILSGYFNGYRVNVVVSDYNGLVNRVTVFLPNASETQVRIQYNKLFNQFKNNDKYIYQILDCSGELSEEEDISYEIAVHDKQYQNVFFYPPWGTMNAFLKKLEEAENPEEVLEDEELMEIAGEIVKDGEVDQLSTFLWSMNHSEGHVWFTISSASEYGKYRVVIYYDNTKNQPNGEDL